VCGEGAPLAHLCCALSPVTRSGFYAWRDRPESAHTTRDRQLKVLVRASFAASKGRYGSPRRAGPWSLMVVHSNRFRTPDRGECAILDWFSRFVVGWAVSAINDRHLTLKALEVALKRRCPTGGLLHHSDQGCTYASEDYERPMRTVLPAR